MPRLLLVGPPDADRLVPDDKRSFVRHLSLEECPAATLDDILVAVVTSDSAEVLLRTIQGLHRRVPEARIAAVAAPDVVRRLAALLRLAPDVPVDLETWADDQADLPDRVRALHDAAARTVAHQRSLAAIGGRDAARPVPLVRVTLDAVLEHAPFGALVVDDQHRLLAWNPAASDLLQLEARHDGASLRSVFLSADPVVEVATAAFGPGPASGSGRVVTVLGPDGVRLDISASPTHVADGREAVLVIVQDATARHTAEAARDKLSAQVELIGQVSEALLLASDDQDALQRVMLQVVPALADWVEIQVYDDRAVTERVVALHSDPSLAELTRSVEQALAGGLSADSPSRRIARGEGPILLPEITPSMLDRFVDDPHVRRLLEQLGVTSAVAVPLPGRTTLMGSLVLLTRGDSPLLGEQELSVAVEIGRRVGLSLENLQMQSRQRALAEALQRSMLTDPRQPDGAQIEVRYRPAAGEAQVGGDWYDSFVQPGGSVVLSVGDVMGHDSRAAAAMGQLRGVLRGIA